MKLLANILIVIGKYFKLFFENDSQLEYVFNLEYLVYNFRRFCGYFGVCYLGAFRLCVSRRPEI